MTGRAIAVIGAGIAGCLIARELAARDPEATITVFDRDLVGSGVTRRSAGVSMVRGSTPRTARMSRFSHDYYAALRAADPQLPIHPVNARLILTGAVDGTSGPSDLGYSPDHIGSSAAGLADQLDNDLRLPPGTRLHRIDGCHHADVYALTQVIAAQTRQTGTVSFAESVKVTDLAVNGTGTSPGVTLSTSDGNRRTFDQAVLAPGPWLNDPAWHDLVAPLGLRVKKIVAMHLDRPPKPDDELIIFEAEDAFLLPVAHRGHWLLSYTRIEWDVDPDAIAAGIGLSPGDVEAARETLRPYSPALADACVSGRVCCDAYSPSREPVVTALGGTDGAVVFAGAANGSGYRLAPAIATEAVDLLYPSQLGSIR